MRDLVSVLGIVLLIITTVLATALLMQPKEIKGLVLTGEWECTDKNRHTGECFQWSIKGL